MKRIHLQLFFYETTQTLLELEDLPHLTTNQTIECQQWYKTKRKILNFEVHSQSWVKVTLDGFSSQLELQPNGKLIEKDLFTEQSVKGLWHVSDGFLFIKIISGEVIVEYQIIGSNLNNIHSGFEYINGILSSYSKFIQIKNN
ncbi:hypothetical protein CTM76_16815 [Photobacterium phosphoreum]|uniref:Uncharacterized protein n=1 Tax=Photobacterium toruni TaxID=1935446 RepID=A0ABU6L3D3_9GAMM|nr:MULTISPECIES: hypothetical protein [Photobacterium]MEC6798041.1 hypothetical protein [Photobacterium sp. S4TG1]MEC6831072.1 hypothetical protein [Photobacterium toruni]PSU76055.1 hypothetical protein CTM76_16815 [Photobacterium phosphoreum]